MKKIVCLLLVLLFLPLFSCKESAAGISYEIEAFLTEDYCLNATAVVSFNAEADSAAFNLYGAAYREGAAYPPVTSAYEVRAYRGEKSYGNMEITGVYVEDEKTEYSVAGEDENFLIVPLDKSGQTSIKIEYTINLAKIRHRLGYTDKTVNLGNFYPVLAVYSGDSYQECPYYPIGDPFYSECASYSVRIRASGEYTVASSGTCIGVASYGDETEYLYKIENARNFALVLNKDYEVIKDSACGIAVSYFYYADTDAADTMDVIKKSLVTFTELYGAYPFDTYTVAECGFCYGGMEYASLAFIADNLDEAERRDAVIHETAHMWWAMAVGVDERKCAFIDEGLAEYSVALFYEKYGDYGITREFLLSQKEKAYRAYCSIYGKLTGLSNTVMDRQLGTYKTEYDYINIAYNKGALMFDELRKSIGDNKFFAGLKRVYADYKYKNIDENAFVNAYGACGSDIASYLNSWITGKVIY